MKPVYNFLIIALSFFMPLWEKAVPIVILLIVVNWIIGMDIKDFAKKIKNSKTNTLLLSFSGLYILYLIGALYSFNILGVSGAMFDLEVKLSLLVFPVIFSTIDDDKLNPVLFKKALYFFVLGCLASTIVLLSNAILSYLDTGVKNTFFYARLSMDFHPAYLSLYLNFSIAILLFSLVFNQVNKHIHKLAVILVVLYLEIFIVLLSSKAGIIGLIIILSVFIILIVNKRKQQKIRTVGIVLSALIFLVLALWTFPSSYNRFFIAKDAFKDDLKATGSNTDGKISRVLLWRSSFEIIKENPLFGVGTGDVIPELRKNYEAKGLAEASKHKLNAHSQYLQTAIAIGLPGIVFLILSLFYPAILSIKRNQFLYLLFLILIIFNMLFESLLERQEGVTFYAFFNVLLFYFSFEKTKMNNYDRI